MRILYVAQNYYPMNASAITTHGIIKKLAERGHEITLVAPKTCPKRCIPNCSLECENNARITVVRAPTFVSHNVLQRFNRLRILLLAFSHLTIVLKAFKICSRKEVDVVVSQHHPSHLASLSAFVVSRIFSLPLIVKTHDVYNSSSNLPQFLILRSLDSIYRVVFRRADSILVVSSPLRSAMIDTYRLEENRVVVFPNGVDTKVFRPNIPVASLRRDLQLEGKKALLFIGSVREERGVSLLVKALPEIIAKDPDIRLLIVGRGPHRSRVNRLAQELAVEKCITFVPPVEHHEIPKYICACDVAVGPLIASIDTFGSVPRKVLEYMACAKPVVVCHGGVSSDLIIDGYNGFIVRSNSSEELAATFLKVLESPELIKETGLNGRRSIERFYDWEKIIDRFDTVLNSLSRKTDH